MFIKTYRAVIWDHVVEFQAEDDRKALRFCQAYMEKLEDEKSLILSAEDFQIEEVHEKK